MTIEQYISNINQRFLQGNATEHTYRSDLQVLIESIVPDIRATNEPKRQSCGAPDYIITKIDKSEKNSGVPIGYIEAKDIGDKDLLGEKKTGNKEQFDRYRTSLANLIFTDYIVFHFIQNEKLIKSIQIAEIVNGKIKPLPENFADFELYIKNFCSYISQTITQSSELVSLMAKKTRLFANAIQSALIQDIETAENSELYGHYQAFRQTLIEDISPEQFADIYAQTVTYGFFAARYRDYTLQDFSREEASRLIPSSNPFLKKLFQFISQIDLDHRILWIVEDLVSIFLATNLRDILHRYGVKTKMEDPIIHFYEDFLREYDPKLRKARGVWYTPAPVVNFIVRAVDDILKSEFGLSQGLADTSKIFPSTGGVSEGRGGIHKVQILDPATGTGTFLAEVIKQIHKKFEGQQGIWNQYVEQHLVPRLNGFELLMASYSMAHLQLEILLSELSQDVQTESKLRENTNRFNIFLTNSLEEAKNERPNLFMAQWLTEEAMLADKVKRDTPVMCVIGNPPYSGESANKGEWIMKLMEDYKKEPGGKEKLKEQNSKFINDDYVKFIRYGQHFIEKNGSGILAFINPHGFLDNPTFRGMRWHLLKTFDKINTIDLHGNAKKKETARDGSADVNVFDIEQGVSINFFIKTGKKKENELGQVFHYDLFGKRENKYDFLYDNFLSKVKFVKVKNQEPNYFFIPKDFNEKNSYDKGFHLLELFNENSLGVLSKNDDIAIAFDSDSLNDKIKDLISLSENDLIRKYSIKNDSRDWVLSRAILDLKTNFSEKNLNKIAYRPFDNRWTFFSGKTRGFFAYSQNRVMHNLKNGENFALISGRQGQAVGSMLWNLVFISNSISDQNIYYRGGGSVFPLYLYPDTSNPDVFNSSERVPNLNINIVNEIAKKLGLRFVPEKFPSTGGVPEGRGGLYTEDPANPTISRATSKRHTKNYMNLPYNPDLTQRAKELRQAGNLSEVLFWNQVKKGQFKGYDFDRQKVIGNYIVDFYCANCNVVIEIDGSSHDDKVEYDKKRDEFLESLGLTVIHIDVQEVFNNMDGVIEMLMNHSAFSNEPSEDNNHPALKGTLDNNHPALKGTLEKNHPALSGTPPEEGKVFAPIDILDYIYAVLHSPNYREKYKEFLKIDFPRVPYPKDKETFWKLVKLGGEIRQIHLLESPIVEKYITQYPIDGDNVVTKPRFSPPLEGSGEVGKVFINDKQYFNNVSEVAWNFYIGGYQPAQKWLKDRKERKLEFDDILHYQKIIVALTETDRLMKEVDKVGVE